MAYIAVDFDGTVVTHEYPIIGQPVPGALDTMKRLQRRGHLIILWTMRSGKELEEAVHYLQANGIKLHGINENPTQKSWTQSPKAYAQYYIDDAAVGCPLIEKDGQRPYVNWSSISALLVQRGILG